MNIDKTMQIDVADVAELTKFDDDGMLTYTEREWRESGYMQTNCPNPHNVRRKFYRLLDKITGEPGKYGAFFVCHNPVHAPASYEVHFENR